MEIEAKAGIYKIPGQYIFRFDDVAVVANIDHIGKIMRLIEQEFESVQFILAVSPICESDDTTGERIYPKIFNAYSDPAKFFTGNKIGIPDLSILPHHSTAGHGLVHVDHRLLSKDAQELSIVTSCALVKADTFVPPFNKYNDDTDVICQKHGIYLVKFEQGWKCMEYEMFNPEITLWYLHAREMSMEKIFNWITDARRYYFE